MADDIAVTLLLTRDGIDVTGQVVGGRILNAQAGEYAATWTASSGSLPPVTKTEGLTVEETPDVQVPTVIGSIADRTYTVGQTVPATDLRTKFDGATSYIISPALNWVSIDGYNLTFDTSEELEETSFSVRGVNDDGQSNPLTFKLTVNVAQQAPALTAVVTPNPIVMDEPFTVEFNTAPDDVTSSPTITGSGTTYTGTGPATSPASIGATKAGHTPYSATITVDTAVITPAAPITPVVSFEGKTGNDLPNIATLMLASNYTRTGRTIQPPQFRINGTVRPLTAVFAIGDVADVLLTDSGGTSRAFHIATVEYAFVWETGADGTSNLTINPAYPEDEEIAIEWDGTTSYISRAEMADGQETHRAPMLGGTPVVGEVLTWDLGLRWRDPDLPAATGESRVRADGTLVATVPLENTREYTVASGDAGKTITVGVVLDGVEVVSDGLVVTAASTPITFLSLQDFGGTEAAKASSPFAKTGISFGDAHAERDIIVAITVGDAPVPVPSSVTIGGVSATRIGGTNNGGQVVADLWKARVPTGTSGNISIVTTGGTTTWNLRVAVFRGVNLPSLVFGAANYGGGGTPSASITGAKPGSPLFGVGENWQDTVAPVWTGGTEITRLGSDTASAHNATSVAEGVTDGSGAATMTVDYGSAFGGRILDLRRRSRVMANKLTPWPVETGATFSASATRGVISKPIEKTNWANGAGGSVSRTVMGGRIAVIDVPFPGAVAQHDGTYALDLRTTSSDETRVQVNSAGQTVTLNIQAPTSGAKWSSGIHWVPEMDPETEDFIIEPGRNHRKVYVTMGAHGYTPAEIAAELGVSVGTITNGWLKANPIWGGSPEKALYGETGLILWDSLTRSTKATPQSHWLMLERGYTYTNATSANGAYWPYRMTGESKLHPSVVRSYGTGAPPILNGEIGSADATNKVMMDVRVNVPVDIPFGGDILLVDIHPSINNLAAYNLGTGHYTAYRCGVFDIHKTAPVNGSYWTSEPDRIAGFYVSNNKSLLLWDCWFDHIGWKDDYSVTDAAYPANPNDPTDMHSHNLYINNHPGPKPVVTVDGLMSSRSSSHGIQLRCGGIIRDSIFLDNNIAGNDLGGNYGEPGYNGYWGLFQGNIVTSAAYRDSPFIDAINWGFEFRNNGGTKLDNIALHTWDPNNAAEQSAKKLAAAGAGQPARQFAISANAPNGVYFENDVEFNWSGVDRRVGGLDPAVLNATTIQNFAATVLPNGTPPTITNLMSYAKGLTSRGRQLLHRAAQEYFRTPVASKLELPITKRTVSTLAHFKPDHRGEGILGSNPMNWSTGDIPGRWVADAVELHGNLVRMTQHTVTWTEVDFGGGRLEVSGGKVTAQAHADAANVVTRWSGQYFAPANADGDYLAVEDSRLVFGGAATVDLEVGGNAEVILGPNLTIPTGKELTITGGDCWVGLDGSGTASLTVQGTLAFNAGNSNISDAGVKIGKLQRFKRRGDDPAPTVAVTVTLEAGSTVTVNKTGLAAGSTHDLTGPGVTVVNQGATLPAGAVVTSGKLVLTA